MEPVASGYPAAAPQYAPQQAPVHQGHTQQFHTQQLPASQAPDTAPQPQWAATPPPPVQPAPAPWGAAGHVPAAASGQPGRSFVDALLNGDWGGAARTAGIAVGAMLAVSLLGMLLITEGGVGFRETIALVFAGVCLAVGGDAFAEADAESFGGSVTLGLLPLTVTLVGVGLLGWLFAKQVRNQPTTTDGLLQGARTALVFAAFFLPMSLLTRYETEQSDVLGLVGQLGVGVVSTLIGALLFAVAALGLAWLFARTSVLPGRVRTFVDKARAPLAAAVAVFAVGLLAALVALIWSLVEQDEPMIQMGVAVLAAGNAALISVLLSAGVPLNMEGSVSGSLLGQFVPTGSGSVDLFTFTDESGWLWLAPVVLLAAVVLVAAALAVRQNTIEDARREGLRFAGALAAVAFAATLLLRIGMESASGVDEFSSATADGSVMFNPIFAAVVLAVWGVVAGLLAPVVAAKLPAGFVVGVRRRFGAAEPTTPVV
jgi:hypothetical protein